ncbi:hypothetical protein GALMADRAFT_141716 [Galerina marginata CBS 339.88]|uniref:Uncharacterized protein n=1 Tax=Galerina marginata (strain CBS 339.88) TaxID=685588 RepID=A0A067SSR3_GALM3|nr:hypothetical protein GALMADRAFT_141716 [Galerina marginata CBS 339.88]
MTEHAQSSGNPQPNPVDEVRNSPADSTDLNNQTTTEAPSTAVPVKISSQCDKIVDNFRSGAISKVNAFLKIQLIIVHADRPFEGDTAVSALESYLSILDNFEKFRNAAASAAPEPASQPERNNIDPSGEPHDSDPDESDAGVSSGTKRPRSEEPFEESGDASKRRVDLHRLPWAIQESISPSVLSPELQQTQSALENYGRDIKFVKSLLLNSARCPQFPDGEWTNLLAGRVVDLDHVLSGVYSLAADDRRREHVGSLELVLGTSAPAKNVRSHSEWVIAFDILVDATVYAFPHRKAELTSYGKYIKQLFTAFPAELHTRVINFDKAVRLRAAQRRDLLLTDHSAFADLGLIWLHNPGSHSAVAKNPKPTASSSSNTSRRREPSPVAVVFIYESRTVVQRGCYIRTTNCPFGHFANTMYFRL